jgi:hypothetical protein
MFGRPNSISFDQDRAAHSIAGMPQPAVNTGAHAEADAHSATELARCYLRLANLPNYALDRLSRYEATLWRQVGQILFALDHLDRRKPQERRRRIAIGHRQELGACERDEC